MHSDHRGEKVVILEFTEAKFIRSCLIVFVSYILSHHVLMKKNGQDIIHSSLKIIAV